MLPQENRLKRKKDFEILFNEGRFCGTQFFTAKYWKINSEKYPRREFKNDDLLIGFVVSKKFYKLAVKRNRLKRQMREIVRPLVADGKLKKGYLVLIMAKAGSLEVDFEEKKKDLDGLLKRMKIL